MGSEKIFKEIKRLLKQKRWKEQKCGEIYINGTLGTNFWKRSEIIHVSLDWNADKEIIENMKK